MGINTLVAFDLMAAGSASAQPEDPTTTQNRQDQKEAFLQTASTQIRNSGHLTLPTSPYQVMAGTVIAAALVTDIKSDLSGKASAGETPSGVEAEEGERW